MADDADEDKPEGRQSRISSGGGGEGKPKERKSTKFAGDDEGGSEGLSERRRSSKKKKEGDEEEGDDDFKKPKAKSASIVSEGAVGRRRSSKKKGEDKEEGADDSTKVKSKSASISEGGEDVRRRSSGVRKSGSSDGAASRRRSTRSSSVGGKGRRKSQKTEEADGKRRESSGKETSQKEGGDDEGETGKGERRRTFQEILQDEDEKMRGHATEIGRAVEERTRHYRETLKMKVGEGWVVNKGIRVTRESLGLTPRKPTIEKKERIKVELSSVMEPEVAAPEARPSAVKRMKRRERGEEDLVVVEPESPSTTDSSELKEIPVRPLFPPDMPDYDTISVLQDAFKQAMFGAIEARMVKGDKKSAKSADRSRTDVEKLLGIPATDYSWEELAGEGGLASPRDVEGLMMAERAVLAQEAYRDNQPLEKPTAKKQGRKLSDILHEIEDDFKKLYELVEEEKEGEGEDEDETATTTGDVKQKETEGEWDIMEREREMLREQGRELVRSIQRYRGTGFGTNLGDILGWDSLRKYELGIQDLGDEGLSRSEMSFLIQTLQQKLAEEKEQNERMLTIMRKRQFRVKQLYDAENMRFMQRRTMMLHGDEEDEDLRMLWDYIDDAMIYFRKAERYM